MSVYLQRLAADHASLSTSGLPPNFLFPSDVSVVAASSSGVGSISAPANSQPDSLIESSDGHSWLDVLLAGPDSSPYANGLFRLRIEMANTYPNTPPIAYFRTRIWHPNVDETSGQVYSPILKSSADGGWNHQSSLWDVLSAISQLLSVPDLSPKSRSNPEAGRVFARDHEGYEKRAAMMCSVHAPVPRGWTDVVQRAKGKQMDSAFRQEELDPRREHRSVESASVPISAPAPAPAPAPVLAIPTISLSAREQRLLRLRQARTKERQQLKAQAQASAHSAPQTGRSQRGMSSQPESEPTSVFQSQSSSMRFPPPPSAPLPPSQTDQQQAAGGFGFGRSQQSQPPSSQPSSSLFTPVHRSVAHFPVEPIPATPELQTTAAIHARYKAARQQQQQQQNSAHHQQQQRLQSYSHTPSSSTPLAQTTPTFSDSAFITPAHSSSHRFRTSAPTPSSAASDPFSRTPAPDSRFRLKNTLLSSLPGSSTMTPQSPLPPNPALIKRVPVTLASRRLAAASGTSLPSQSLFSSGPSRERQPGMYVAVPSSSPGLESDRKGRSTGSTRRTAAATAAFMSPTSIDSHSLTPPKMKNSMPMLSEHSQSPHRRRDSSPHTIDHSSSRHRRNVLFQSTDNDIELDEDAIMMNARSLHPTPPPDEPMDWYECWMEKWTDLAAENVTKCGVKGEADVQNRFRIAGYNWDVYNQGGGGPRIGIMRA